LLKRRLIAPLALLAAAVPVTTAIAGSGTDRATGGGQILVSSSGGAGDTIAFTAQGTSSAATGQVQYVDRSGGTGQGQAVLHGTVTCLNVQGNMAKIAGVWAQGGTFQLLVADNGEGAASNSDLVTLQNNEPNDCSQDMDDSNQSTELARGNAQVYDASQ